MGVLLTQNLLVSCAYCRCCANSITCAWTCAQARVFAPHLQAEKKAKAEGKPYGASVTDEAMVFMSVVGTALMAIIAGP